MRNLYLPLFSLLCLAACSETTSKKEETTSTGYTQQEETGTRPADTTPADLIIGRWQTVTARGASKAAVEARAKESALEIEFWPDKTFMAYEAGREIMSSTYYFVKGTDDKRIVIDSVNGKGMAVEILSLNSKDLEAVITTTDKPDTILYKRIQ